MAHERKKKRHQFPPGNPGAGLKKSTVNRPLWVKKALEQILEDIDANGVPLGERVVRNIVKMADETTPVEIPIRNAKGEITAVATERHFTMVAAKTNKMLFDRMYPVEHKPIRVELSQEADDLTDEQRADADQIIAGVLGKRDRGRGR